MRVKIVHDGSESFKQHKIERARREYERSARRGFRTLLEDKCAVATCNVAVEDGEDYSVFNIGGVACIIAIDHCRKIGYSKIRSAC